MAEVPDAWEGVPTDMKVFTGKMPLWVGNGLVFASLFLLTTVYFSYQVNNASKIFIEDAKAHARLVAGIIGIHAKGTILSEQVIEEVLKTFLGNEARFVEYLDSIEPFDQEELTAFAKESGLAGITIYRGRGDVTQGPPGWLKEDPGMPVSSSRRFFHNPDEHVMALVTPLKGDGGGCVITGVRSLHIERLQKEIGLASTLRALEGLKGIRYIKLYEKPPGRRPRRQELEVRIRGSGPEAVAEVEIPVETALVAIGLDARPLAELKQRLWTEFAVFSLLLAVSGSTLSWLLYRHQMGYLKKVRGYERRLSRQREDAALGRAAAAIAHEIRNPLNAMAMGLQRLKMESKNLSRQERRIIDIILDSLERTNGIVTRLLHFARMPKPEPRLVYLDELLKDALALYQGRLAEAGIELKMELGTRGRLIADPGLLQQVIDNLFGNAIEAQPQGGFIRIELYERRDRIVLAMENPGDIPGKDQASRLLLPYYTTKARGTGLGLAMCNRIVRAHGGEMEVMITDDDTFRVVLEFSRDAGMGGEADEDTPGG